MKVVGDRRLETGLDLGGGFKKGKNSNVPHYYTNRALCYLNQKRWPQAVQDARQALEKDPNLVKGHFYLGKYIIQQKCSF